jgi:transcription elongation GreA/GreB family factor
MTNQEILDFKSRLKKVAEQLLTERISMSKAAIDNAQEAANSDSKSSAGDKYETGRAMGHLEKDMYSRQLAENMRELSSLQQVNTGIIYHSAQTGAVVQCPDQSFFIATGLGKQLIDDHPVYFVSPNTPIAKLLLHKKAGDSFVFNKMNIVITKVC